MYYQFIPIYFSPAWAVLPPAARTGLRPIFSGVRRCHGIPIPNAFFPASA